MEENVVTPTQETPKRTQPNEAGFSCNLYLNHQTMGRVQFTFRGATSAHWSEVLHDVNAFLRYMKEQGWQFDGQASEPKTVPQPEPSYQPIDDGGNDLPQIFKGRAGHLSVKMEDNKVSFSLKDCVFQQGRKSSKFPIAIYPETLEAAGLSVEQGQPVPDVNGWGFEYIENAKGFPAKVTRLLPPKVGV